MIKELSEYSTETLLAMIHDDVKRDEDFNSRAEQNLLNRWRKGLDLDPLLQLLQSDATKSRLRGAYYLGEVALAVDGLMEPATKLARDPLPQCRNVFVSYMTNSGFYNDKIEGLMAACLADFHLDVQLETINWAVSTSDDRFEGFCTLVEAGTGLRIRECWTRPWLKRSLQALLIARRLRAGHSVADMRGSTREIDGFILDYLEAFEDRLKRYVEGRKSASANLERPAQGGDRSFEIGTLGVEYDRRGRIMSDFDRLPNELPAHVSLEQLDVMLARSNESLKQRALDGRMFA